MDVVLNIHEPKFKNGQVVRLQNRYNKHGIYILICSHQIVGDFHVENGFISTYISDNWYYVVIQDCSLVDTSSTAVRLIRPGKYLMLDLLDVEMRGKVVEWSELKITADTPENIQERTDKWSDDLGAWKEPLSKAAL